MGLLQVRFPKPQEGHLPCYSVQRCRSSENRKVLAHDLGTLTKRGQLTSLALTKKKVAERSVKLFPWTESTKCVMLKFVRFEASKPVGGVTPVEFWT